jgi:hypothetical protein
MAKPYTICWRNDTRRHHRTRPAIAGIARSGAGWLDGEGSTGNLFPTVISDVFAEPSGGAQAVT